MPLLWPTQLFQEMNINIPNASLWVTNKNIVELHGMGYPIFLEDKYIEEIREILEKTIWNVNSKIAYINIDNLADKHEELRMVMRERLKDMLINNYECPESILPDLTFSLYQLSLSHDSSK